MKRTDLSPIPIPITVLTGFLGSGKTTVLDYLGRTGALSRTLVLVNEFGEVGLDHELLVPIDDDTLVAVNSGCICCTDQRSNRWLGSGRLDLWLPSLWIGEQEQ